MEHSKQTKVWFHCSKENDDKLTSCRSSFTSNMTKYLRQQGTDVKGCMLFGGLQPPSQRVSSASGSTSQVKEKLIKAKTEDCHRLLTTLVVKGLQPLSVVKSHSFR